MFTFPAAEIGGPEVVIHATLANFVQFSLGTSDPAIAKQRTGLAAAQLARICDAIKNGPKPLSQKQRVALAGLLYRAFAESLEDNPGSPELWEQIRATNENAASGGLGGKLCIDPSRREFHRNTIQPKY